MDGRRSGKIPLRAGRSRPPIAGGPTPKTLPRSTDQMREGATRSAAPIALFRTPTLGPCEDPHQASLIWRPGAYRDYDLMSISEVGRTVVHRLCTLFVLRRR